MRFLETIRSVMTTDGIEGTLTETLVRHIEESNPSLRLKRARLVMGDGKGFNLIDRSGILYFVKPPYEVLNPYCGAGTGLQLVKGSNSDPTGVYLTRKRRPPTRRGTTR